MRFTNTWTNKEQDYDPDTEGYWIVRIKPGQSTRLADGSRWDLGCGDSATPQRSESAGLAEFALVLAVLPPELHDKIALYKAPCTFSVGGDVLVADHHQVPAELLEEARKAASWWVNRDNFKRKHAMSSIAM